MFVFLLFKNKDEYTRILIKQKKKKKKLKHLVTSKMKTVFIQFCLFPFPEKKTQYFQKITTDLHKTPLLT